MGDGTVTSEPLNIIASDDPVSCAQYAKQNGLLEKEGWKRFKRLANREKKLLRMVNQSRMKSVRRAPVFQYGVQVPRNHKEAISHDQANGNTKRHDLAVVLKDGEAFLNLLKRKYNFKLKRRWTTVILPRS
jgi:hypothetical protein